jgi:ABC-type enterochelin transport system substrate-binding protein
LNLKNAADQISYVVDINPRKQGMYVSGTGQEIVSPEFLKDYDPDLVLIMNPIYNEEIRGVMRLLDISCHIQCV